MAQRSRRRTKPLHEQVEEFAENLVQHLQEDRNFDGVQVVYNWLGQFHQFEEYNTEFERRKASGSESEQESSSNAVTEERPQQSTGDGQG